MITLCSNTTCPIRQRCYRGTTERTAYVKVERFVNYHIPGTMIVKCDNFLPPRRAL